MREGNQPVTETTNRRFKLRSSNNLKDFSKVGGLSNHIKLLREIIIFPLLYADLYKHFNIKAPRGVLFYGPPGTGKTLVAGALATELSKEANGKVTFYQRKGADILDKWVGESERKLRELFHQATKTRPSVIFFDEIDGLAPVRSQKHDQVHCSVVATLLALMDGLDNMTGVVVIGATNRIDAIDPALRRPGRFDRELYFPLPSATARKEILQVHTFSWKNKPSGDFLLKIAELTSGCCGCDLQALCAEAVLCSLKREYPDVHKPYLLGNRIKIDLDKITVEEVDFLNARMNLVPTSQRLGNYRIRKLSPFIKPLLQRQVDKIMNYINILLPHFTQPFKKFLVGNERYAGRLVLKGNNQQGLTVHIIPAILQALEHIPCYILDIPALFETNIKNARQNLPSILVLSRIDEWWNLIETSIQLSLTAMMEDLHAGIPLFLIATCNQELPSMLQDYFYNNSSIVLKIDDPNVTERENFFAPLFFGNAETSVVKVLKKDFQSDQHFVSDAIQEERPTIKCKRRCLRGRKNPKIQPSQKHTRSNLKRESDHCLADVTPTKRLKLSESLQRNFDERTERLRGGGKDKSQINHLRKHPSVTSSIDNHSDATWDRASSIESMMVVSPCESGEVNKMQKQIPNPTLVDMIDCSVINDKRFSFNPFTSERSFDSILEAIVKQEPKSETSLHQYNPFESTSKLYHDTTNPNMEDIFNLWKRTAHITSADLPVGQLEFLYDTIAACIVVKKHKYQGLIDSLEKTLIKFEQTKLKSEVDHLE